MVNFPKEIHYFSIIHNGQNEIFCFWNKSEIFAFHISHSALVAIILVFYAIIDFLFQWKFLEKTSNVDRNDGQNSIFACQISLLLWLCLAGAWIIQILSKKLLRPFVAFPLSERNFACVVIFSEQKIVIQSAVNSDWVSMTKFKLTFSSPVREANFAC